VKSFLWPILLAHSPTHPLAHVNALLNGTAAVLLVIGLVLIRRRRERAHKRVMLAAFAVSVAFLVSYVAYHFGVLGATTTKFAGQGPARAVYFAVLVSHILLAFLVPPLAVTTIALGLRCDAGGTTDSGAPARSAGPRHWHRRLARLTLPIWLYVSSTGVVVYLMLYHLYSTAPP